MSDPVTNEVHLLIYSLNISQHNSFVLSENLTEYYRKGQHSNYSNLFFTGLDRDLSIIGVMNDVNINLYQTQYYNKLVLTQDPVLRNTLIDECKDIKQSNPVYQDKKDQEIIKEIDNVVVQAVSLFKRVTQISEPEKKVNITIKSQNQGMAVSLKTEQDRAVAVSYGNDY
jgi:hypothetical protein